MAPFNPQLQEITPKNFVGLSQASAQPQPDTSGETLFSGISGMVSSGTKFAEDVVKKALDDKVWDAVNPIVENRIGELQGARDAIKTAANPEAAAGATGAGAAMPAQLANLPKSLDVLSSARANGKISQSEYDMKLYSAASQLRTQFPTYKDYIGQKFNEVTNYGDANKLIGSLVGDINASVENLNKARDRKMAVLYDDFKDGVYDPKGINAATIVRKVESGQMSLDDAMQWHAGVRRDEWTLKVAENRLKTSQTSKGQLEIDTKDYVDATVTSDVNNFLKTQFGATGISLNQSIEVMRKMATGEIKPDAEQAQAHLTAFATYRNVIAQNMVNKGQQKIEEGPHAGKTFMEAAGGQEAWNKKVNDGLSLYDKMVESWKDEKYGVVGQVVRANNALIENLVYKTYNGPEAQRVPALQLGLIGKMLGGHPTALQNWITFNSSGGNPPNFTPIIESVANNAAIQPGLKLPPDMQKQTNVPQGNPVTFESEMTKLKGAGLSKTGEKEVGGALVRLNEWAKDSSKGGGDEMGEGLATFFFHPDNQPMLNRFAKEGTLIDGTNKVTQGRHAIFAQLTDQSMTKAIKDLSERKSNPQIWNNYVNWAHESFANILWRDDLATLRDTQYTKNMDIKYVNDDNSPKFVVADKDPMNMKKGVVAPEVRNVQEAAARINQGLSNMVHIAKAEKSEINNYVFKLLANSDSAEGTVPNAMLKAILATVPKKTEKK